MSIIQGVLLEEIERLQKNIAHYESMLLSLPRGTIFIKNKYVYRKRKDNGVVISTYLGKIEQDSVKKEIEKSREFKRIKSNLITAKKELAKLRKAYKSYE